MTKPMRKPVATGGKARAAQLPKASSNKSSFAFQSQSSTSQNVSTKHKMAGTMSFDQCALPRSSGQGQIRFASPKTTHSNGFGLSKTATVQHESHSNIHGRNLQTPYDGSYYKQGGTTGRQVEQQSTQATTANYMASPAAFKNTANHGSFGSAIKGHQKQKHSSQYGKNTQQQSTGFTPNRSFMSGFSKQQTTKKSAATTAYLQRFDAARDINAFWKNVKDISMHKNKIDAIDSRLRQQRGMEDPAPTATVAQRGSEAVYQPRSARGAGGIHQSMNGESQQRRVGGVQHPEYNNTGNSMHSVMNPPSKDPRRASSQQAVQSRFARSSQAVGSNANMFGGAQADPAEMLKPQKNFRKANEASQDRLWTRENDFDLYGEKKLTKNELSKTRSQERYFQSSISTLPGPSKGVNVVKQITSEKRDRSEADHIQRKKGTTFDQAFSSHISTLPGTHQSTQNTMEDQQAAENARREKRYNDPNFKLRQSLYSSYMQDTGDSRQNTTQSGGNFKNQMKGTNDDQWNKRPTSVSSAARAKFYHTSQVTF